MLDPTGLGSITVDFEPEDVEEMGWTKRFTLSGPPGGFPAYALRRISVNCFDTGLGNPCFCDVDCWILARFRIEIWYVFAIRRGWRDVPYGEHPKTIEGLFGHEQRHVQNWKNFLFSFERVWPTPLASTGANCSSFAKGIEDAMWQWIRRFADDEFHHRHIPPAAGTHYPPLKGSGTMPEPS